MLSAVLSRTTLHHDMRFLTAVLVVLVMASTAWSQDSVAGRGILNLVQVHYNDTNAAVAAAGGAGSNNSCNCVCGTQNRGQRIVGGMTARLNEYPWLVAMYRGSKFYCGGSLITRRHVVTAAHCVYGINMKDVRVVLGEHDRLSKTETVTLERRVNKSSVHNDFSLSTFNNDIAVLRLDAPVDLGRTVRPICLPPGDRDLTGRLATVAGWGRTDEKKPTSGVLRKVAVPVMSREACLSAGYAAGKVTENMICAGLPEGTKDACQGDSGGPLIISGEHGGTDLVGIVSWGRGCARPNFPGIYTKVANYVDWVKGRLDGDCLCPPLSPRP